MKKYIAGAVLSLGVFVSPALIQAASLTTQQANSLIAVVQSAPGVPASAFVNLITSFSNITVNQATSLITVVQSAPTAPANAFVNLLISFTSDSTTSQSTTSATNQSATTQPAQSTSALAPTISYITPTSVVVGGTVYVHGANFNSSTYVAFDGDFGKVIYPDNAPASGTGVFSFTVPSTNVGAHTIQVNEKGATFPSSSAVTLNVVAAPTLSYINPTSVRAGGTVWVYGANFNSSTYIAFDGDFGQVIYPDNAPASGTGVFSFTVPANASVGSHSVQVNEKGATFPSSSAVTLSVVQ
ncbi:MAG: hypothetical protein WCT41_03365 [Candidatus Paceibacterota bacterium]|jgi:hypothetical protein